VHLVGVHIDGPCQIVGQARLKATEHPHVLNTLVIAERAFQRMPDCVLIEIPRNEFNRSQSGIRVCLIDLKQAKGEDRDGRSGQNRSVGRKNGVVSGLPGVVRIPSVSPLAQIMYYLHLIQHRRRGRG
jgi:hypothetical protein